MPDTTPARPSRRATERGSPPRLRSVGEENANQGPRLGALLAAIAACLAIVGLILLFGGGSSEPGKPASAQDLPYVDGTLVVVEQTRLVLRPIDGGAEIGFTIRPEDLGNFDLAHLQSHSSVGIPTRIYYEEKDGTKYAVYKEDAPVNQQR